jgi:intracellular septation protein
VSGGSQVLVDLGPVALFMITYNAATRFAPGEAIFWATGAFMVATLCALAYARLVQRRTPPMLLVTAVIVVIFGGLTIALHNALFIKIKPTIINLLYAGAIFGGLAFGQNVWKILFRGAFTLPNRAWTILAVRWGLFFLFLALLNEVIWRNFSEAFWANFKFLGVIPLTVAFATANAPLMIKYMGRSDADDPKALPVEAPNPDHPGPEHHGENAAQG